MSDTTTSLNDWQPIQPFVQDNEQFQENQLRWLIRNRHTNGFDEVVRKIGRRWFISNHRFARWIEGQN